ncbi:MAG: hypothetical protein WC670_19355 [Pseudolabrys sp.]|jgi:hypothetical protein
MAQRPTILLPEYAPDLSDLGTGVSTTITGVVPRADGYGPFKALESFTQALAAAARGYFFGRKSDGSIAVFAGTSTDLYQLDNTTFAWTRVSKGGASYAALVAVDNWRFAQYNDTILATQNNTVPQAFALSSSSAFADLGGSPPQASHVAIVNRFVVLTGLLSNPRRVQWCDLDAITTWTAGVGLADYQDLPDGGTVHNISGGDAYGVIFQDESIRSLIYAPGSAVTFEIVRISTQDTLFGQYSVINAGDKTFFCSAQGFKVIEAGGKPKPIGKERVDRTFFADVDTSQLQLLIGATDPSATRVYWAYKSLQGATGLFDKALCYDWSIGQNGQWSLLNISGEFLASLARPGVTLEQLDPIAPGALSVTGAANNGAGLIRLTLSALSSANFDIHGQNFIVVQGVTGTTEANGTWPFTIIDATHIDLVGSAFANAYVSGGAIGGSLDALPFSLDSISTAALAQLSAFDSSHKLGFFTGDNVEAIMETPEQDLGGDLVFIDAVRPLTDASNAVVSIGGRLTAQAAVSYGTESALTSAGDCPQMVETRYAKARVRIPAASSWTYVRGVQPSAQPAGSL